jgi:hypothetical protein
MADYEGQVEERLDQVPQVEGWGEQLRDENQCETTESLQLIRP